MSNTIPSTPTYPLSALNLFQTYNRTTYLAKFGRPAPPFDPSRKQKGWLDSAGKDSYDVLATVNPPTFGKLTISPEEAASVNLPSDGNYPPYRPATSTPATATGAPTINPTELSYESDAKMLASMLGGTYAEESEGEVTWNGETRRRWFVAVGDTKYNVAEKVQEMYGNGVGAPGKWVDNDGLKWVPSLNPDLSGDPVPMPVRQLVPGEKFEATSGGMAWQIHNANNDPAAPTPGGGSGLTPQQDAKLTTVYNLLVQWAEANGIEVA